MRNDPEYNNYYVYSALYEKGVQTSCGACPVEWEYDEASQKRELTWSDGNYHLGTCGVSGNLRGRNLRGRNLRGQEPAGSGLTFGHLDDL